MSIVDYIDGRIFYIVAFVGPFLFWMYFGLFGKFYPWRHNLIIEKNPPRYIIRGRKIKSMRKIDHWRQDRFQWLISGILGMAIMFFSFSILTMRK